jgi:hypothetical protein
LWAILDSEGRSVGSGRGPDAEEALVSWSEVHRGTFTGGHEDPPNTLVRLRTTDRMIGGEKSLHGEEYQSDWHNAGRKRGYRGRGLTAVKAEQKDGYWEITNEDGGFVTNVYKHDAPSEAEAIAEAQRRLQEAPDRTAGGGVPDAPYKDPSEWVALGLRRQLQEAVDGGYPMMSWSSGEQIADLYDLRKEVSRVDWDGSEMRAFDHDGDEVLSQQVSTPKQLEEYIGKGPADRLAASLDENVDGDGLGVIEGEDLSLGGEWATRLYDGVAVDVANKIFKPLGLTVEDVPIQITSRKAADPDIIQEFIATRWEYGRGDGWDYDDMIGVLRDVRRGGDLDDVAAGLDEAVRDDLYRYIRQHTPATPGFHAVRITPEAAERVRREGQRLGAATAGATAGAAAAGAAAFGVPLLLQRLMDREDVAQDAQQPPPRQPMTLDFSWLGRR